ncbi:hypothetical protein EVG20_g8411, partial [Dentipellis fragilis]
ATSGEFDNNAPDDVIVFMPEISRTHMGGTMRLGLRPTVFQAGTEWSKVRQLYAGADKIWERHRHRYEVNPRFVEQLQASGLQFVGKDEKGERMQIMELTGASPPPSLPPSLSYVPTASVSPILRRPAGHPEFCTRPLNPSPPFLGFVAAACGPHVLEEQLANQLKTFKPPHPEESMVSEDLLKQETVENPLTPGRERAISGEAAGTN